MYTFAIQAVEVDAVVADLMGPAGVRLAKEWKLPEAVQVTIKHLGNFGAAGEDQDTVAIAECGVALGRWMCTSELLISDVVQLPAIEHLNLYPEDVQAVLEHQEKIKLSMESMGL